MSDSSVVCSKCNQPCTKDYIKAMGQVFHINHFTCGGCDNDLGGKSFFEHEGAGYCADCYAAKCAPKCNCCQEPIVGDVTTALGKSWKPEHFVCNVCKKNFQAGEGFLEKDGVPYCKTDYYDLYKPKCFKCSQPITDKTVTALDQKWHPECFRCCFKDCGTDFPDGRFFVNDNKPYCGKHRFGDESQEDENNVFAKKPADLEEKQQKEMEQ